MRRKQVTTFDDAGRQVTIRAARWSDAKAVAPLLVELVGPELSLGQAQHRFRRVLHAPSYFAFVATHGSEVVGMWVGRSGFLFATRAPAIQPTALVVRPDRRGAGIGRLLMTSSPLPDRFVQNWFVTQHEHLHSYYEGMGWSATGTRFVRHLGPPADRPFWSRVVDRILGG